MVIFSCSWCCYCDNSSGTRENQNPVGADDVQVCIRSHTPIPLAMSSHHSYQLSICLLTSRCVDLRQVGSAVRLSIGSNGLVSLWRGWSPLMWRDVPFSAVYFTLYEAMKAWVLQYYNTKNITTVHSFCFGAISGMVSHKFIPLHLLISVCCSLSTALRLLFSIYCSPSAALHLLLCVCGVTTSVW